MPRLRIFQFLDQKANSTLQFSLNFLPDGKMAYQLLMVVLYEFTLKFIKMKNLHPIVSSRTQRETYEFKTDNRNLNYSYYCHFTVIMDIIQSE